MIEVSSSLPSSLNGFIALSLRYDEENSSLTPAGIGGFGASISGGVTELMMPSSKLEEPGKVAPVVSAVASFVTGGSAKDITTASSVSSSVVENNHDLHQIQALLDMEATGELEVGSTVEELSQQPLGQATEFAVEHPVEAAFIAADVGLIAFTGGASVVAKRASVEFATQAPKLVKGTESVLQGMSKVAKPRGINNETVRAAQERGIQAHEKFKKKIKAKEGWQPNPRIYDKEKNKYLIPDALSPSGRPVELKPRTISGIKKGEKQLKEYEKAFQKKGKVIYYDPE